MNFGLIEGLALLCSVSLCIHQVTAWARIDVDRWWKTVFKNIEHHEIASDMFLPGHRILPGEDHQVPMLIRVIVMNACSCKADCNIPMVPKEDDEIDESKDRSRITPMPDGSRYRNSSDDSNQFYRYNGQEGRREGGDMITPSPNDDTILPPRYRPKNTEGTMSIGENTPGAAQKLQLNGDLALDDALISTNTRRQRRLRAYFNGIPAVFSTTSR
ncbi:hypothetical protein BIW11_00491 [Tropilaelaps mercedesae]|uniref:Uncharacterized protein n=1 Tax=Tropilaelaps mercedesae TaxID=418985 RepID=A0A1V9XUL0_9ACAR|nr:hypothetical protein BIW11_00491 [Tropilaelaps mercedesae]